jgi:hypothetical protein
MGKALEKFAFAVTKAGHKYDTEEYQANADRFQKRLDNEKKYGREHPFSGYMTGNDPVTRFNYELARNRSLYGARKHREGKNAYNIFAGWSDREKELYDKNKKKIKK